MECFFGFTTALSAMNRIPGNIVHTFAPYFKIVFAYLQKKNQEI